MARLIIGVHVEKIIYEGIELKCDLWDIVERVVELFEEKLQRPILATVPTLKLVTGFGAAELQNLYSRTQDLPPTYQEAISTITTYFEDHLHPGLLHDYLYLIAAYEREKRQQMVSKWTSVVEEKLRRRQELEAISDRTEQNYPGGNKIDDEIHGIDLIVSSIGCSIKEFSEPAIIHLRAKYGPEWTLQELAEAIYLAYSPPSETVRQSSTAWALFVHISFKLSDEPQITISQGSNSDARVITVKDLVKPPANEVERLNLNGQGAGDLKAAFDNIVSSDALGPDPE